MPLSPREQRALDRLNQEFAKPTPAAGTPMSERESRAYARLGEEMNPTAKTVSDKLALEHGGPQTGMNRLVGGVGEGAEFAANMMPIKPVARLSGLIPYNPNPEIAKRERAYDILNLGLTLGGVGAVKGLGKIPWGSALASSGEATALGAAGGGALQAVAGPGMRELAADIRKPEPTLSSQVTGKPAEVPMWRRGLAAGVEMAPGMVGALAAPSTVATAMGARAGAAPAVGIQRAQAAQEPILSAKGVELANRAKSQGIPLLPGQVESLGELAGQGTVSATGRKQFEKATFAGRPAQSFLARQARAAQGFAEKTFGLKRGEEAGRALKGEVQASRAGAAKSVEALNKLYGEADMNKRLIFSEAGKRSKATIGDVIGNTMDMVLMNPTIKAGKKGAGALGSKAYQTIMRLRNEAKGLKTGADALRFRDRARIELDAMFKEGSLNQAQMGEIYGSIRQGMLSGLTKAGMGKKANSIDKALSGYEANFFSPEAEVLERVTGVGDPKKYSATADENVVKNALGSGNSVALEEAARKGLVSKETVDTAVRSSLYDSAMKDGLFDGPAFSKAWTKVSPSVRRLMDPKAVAELEAFSKVASVLRKGEMNQMHQLGYAAGAAGIVNSGSLPVNQHWVREMLRGGYNSLKEHTGYYNPNRNLRPSSTNIRQTPQAARGAGAADILTTAGRGAVSGASAQEDAWNKARLRAKRVLGGGGY